MSSVKDPVFLCFVSAKTPFVEEREAQGDVLSKQSYVDVVTMACDFNSTGLTSLCPTLNIPSGMLNPALLKSRLALESIEYEREWIPSGGQTS